MIKCIICNDKFNHIEDLYEHFEDEHNESIPKNFTPAQYIYFLKTGKDKGKCIVCKRPTKWNEVTNKYLRFCPLMQCKDKYRELFKERMIGKYGKIHLLNSPEQQKKMLANRKISGEYIWSDGTKKTYTGSYELDLLKFLDIFLRFSSEDVMTPSPHVYYYEYEGEEKFYIPDAFIPSLNLEIEVKTGKDNENNHPKIQAVDKVKERLKDKVLMSQSTFNYIKLTNKNYDALFEFLKQAKERFIESNGEDNKPIFVLMESYENIIDVDIIMEVEYHRALRILGDTKDKEKLGPREFYNKVAFRYIYKVGNKNAGFIEVKVKKGYAFFNIFIKEEFRGKGISHALMNEGLEFCHRSKRDINTMVLNIKKTNNISIKLAKKYGFKEQKSDKVNKTHIRFIKLVGEFVKESFIKENKDEKAIDLSYDIRPDSDYNSEQLKIGIEIEQEHTKNLDKARMIAKDHLDEIPDYYSRLVKMEKEAEGEKDIISKESFFNADELKNIKIKVPIITFPKKEWSSIKKRLNSGKVVYTIRVYVERHKYVENNVYQTEWGTAVQVISVNEIKSINEYEFKEYLDDEMKKDIGGARKLEVIALKKINDSYISETYYKVKDSKISGKGIFANKNVDVNTKLLAIKKVDNTGNPDKDYERTKAGQFVNHSNNPNLVLVQAIRNGKKVYFYKSKDKIKKGEELTIDYRQFDFEGKRDFVKESSFIKNIPDAINKETKIYFAITKDEIKLDKLVYTSDNKNKVINMSINNMIKSIIEQKLENLLTHYVEIPVSSTSEIKINTNIISDDKFDFTSIDTPFTIDLKKYPIREIIYDNLTESYNNNLYPVFILLTFTNTNMAKAIKFVTGEPYSHVSISFDSSMNDMYSFGRKFKDSNMTFINEDIKDGLFKDVIKDTIYSLYVIFVTKEQKELMINKLEEFKKKKDKLKFNFIGLFNISIGKETDRQNEYFCSQFVAEILKASNNGMIDKHPSLYKPYDFAKHKETHFVTKGKLENYDKDIVDQNVLKITNKYEIVKESIGKDEKIDFILPIKNLKEGELLVINTHITNITFIESLTNIFELLMSAIQKSSPALAVPLFSIRNLLTQMFALDFMGFNIKTKMNYKSDKNNNDDFYIFNAELVAVSDGEIIDCSDKMEDKFSIKRSAGNYIIIKHNILCYSLYGHIKKGSIKVKKGDKVKQGQVIANVGNSGAGSEPHLHYQLCYLDPKVIDLKLFSIMPTLSSKPLENFKNFLQYPINKSLLSTSMNNLVSLYQYTANELNKIDKIKYELNRDGEIPPFGFVRNKTINENTIIKEENNDYIITELYLTDLPNFNNDEDVYNFMRNNIKNSDFNILKNDDELIESQNGSSHEQAIFIRNLFNNNKLYKASCLFFIEYNEKENTGGFNHTLCYYVKDEKIYWIETSWGEQLGIHGPFNSLIHLKQYIEDIHIKMESNNKYPVLIWNTLPNKIEYGLDLNSYVLFCLNIKK